MMHKAYKFAILFTVMIWTGGLLAPSSSTAHHGPAHDAPALAMIATPTPVVLAAAPSQGEAGVEGHVVGESQGEKHEEDASLLSFQPGAFFWQITLFIILFIVLAKFVWPPILKGLQDREAKIHDDLKRAEDARNEAEATLAEYKKELAHAQREAQKLIEQSRIDAQKVSAQIQAETEVELAHLRQRAQEEINAAKEQALSDLYTQTATLATTVAGQILHREISPDDQEALVQESLAKLKDRN